MMGGPILSYFLDAIANKPPPTGYFPSTIGIDISNIGMNDSSATQILSSLI